MTPGTAGVALGRLAPLIAEFMTDGWVYVGPTGPTAKPTSSVGSPPAGWRTTA
jgi:hypothetical protein